MKPGILKRKAPASKEGDSRKEEKLDYITRKLDPENYERLTRECVAKYPEK